MTLEGHKPQIGICDHTGPSLGGATLVAAHIASLLSGSYSVELIRDWSVFSLEQLSCAFGVDVSKVHARSFEDLWSSFGIPSRHPLYRQLQRSRALTGKYDLFICAGHYRPPFCFAKHGLIYCHFPIELPPSPEQLAESESWKQRNYLERVLRVMGYSLAWRACIGGYDQILANSLFTANWMERRWRTHADVLYPPVDLNPPAVEKQNRVVSVGRFDGNDPARKGHLSQIEAFRRFCAEVQENWELWMIGVCDSERDHAYLERVRNAAADLPIRFLVNASRAACLEVLASAKFFWHTAGLGCRQAENPILAEHFGIATVEAMRAGCIPIVISSGGQREIVQNGVSGFLCSGIEELVNNTCRIVMNPCSIPALSKQAVSRSQDFDGAIFDRRMLQLVERALASAPKHNYVRRALGRLAWVPS